MRTMDVPPGCEACGRYRHAHTPFMAMYGDIPCDVLFVGESPGKTEDRMGRPFWPAAPSGEKLDTTIRKVGLDKYRRAYSNGTRCISFGTPVLLADGSWRFVFDLVRSK